MVLKYTRSLRVRTTQGRGKVKIYVKKGTHETTHNFDVKLAKYGNEESINLTNPTPGISYISLLSPKSFQGIGLQVDIEADFKGAFVTNIVQDLKVKSCGIKGNMTIARLTFIAQ